MVDELSKQGLSEAAIAKALGLMIRTAPFLIFRALVYFGIAASLVIVTGAGAGAGYGIGLFGDEDFQASSIIWGGVAGKQCRGW